MTGSEAYAIQSEKLFQSYLEETKIAIDSELANLASRFEHLGLYEEIKYVLISDGKRLRPTLLALSAQSVGGKWENVKRLALAIELLHIASLVHDDILDQDKFRRNALAVHAKWSVKDAILVGDALASYSLNLAADYDREIMKIISETGLQLCDGEHADVDTTLAKISEKEYLLRIKKKCASIFMAATQCGAIAGGGTRLEIEALARFGENLGLAYQIRDDISDTTFLGTRIPQDIEQQKTNLPLIHAYESSSDAEKEELIKNLQTATDNSFTDKRLILNKILRNLESNGSLSYCYKRIDQFIESAVADTKFLKENVFKIQLVQMANSLRPSQKSMKI